MNFAQAESVARYAPCHQNLACHGIKETDHVIDLVAVAVAVALACTAWATRPGTVAIVLVSVGAFLPVTGLVGWSAA